VENFNKKELDRAYHNFLAVPNSATLLQNWTDSSLALRSEISDELNIAYGATPSQSYDYFSAGNDSPIMIFIFGGVGRGDQRMSVALLGYRLAPKAIMNEIIRDIQNGLHAIEQKVRGERKNFPGFCLLG